VAAQQTLSALNPAPPMAQVAVSRSIVFAAKRAIASTDPAGISGLPWSASLYQAVQPQGPAAVCTQIAPRAVVVPESDYAFGRLQFTAAAIKGTFSHENMVKMARNFAPGQRLPDAPLYVPLSRWGKFDQFLRSTHSAGFALGILSDSLISQATGAYPRFGGGMEGYGKRLGAAAAGEGSAAFIGGFVFPTLLHQDPRYFRSHQNAISGRLAYAASRVFIGRGDDGRAVFNSSVILSQFALAGLSNAYIPYRRPTAMGTVENALNGLGAVAQTNILNEFWPDIKEFFSRHGLPSLLGHEHRAATSGPYRSPR